MRATVLVLGMLATPAFAQQQVTAEVWADNWFALYVDGRNVLTDSVPITTERSFNAEVGEFVTSLPAQVAFVAKDYKEDDTGLEYIGTRKQQMGDGGLIAQFIGADGVVLGATNSDTRCLVVHRAPVDTSCAKEVDPQEGQGACASVVTAEPDGWMDPGFDDSAWPRATEYSEREVRPKDGFDRISWSRTARLIWGPDLERDNTILCRMALTD